LCVEHQVALATFQPGLAVLGHVKVEDRCADGEYLLVTDGALVLLWRPGGHFSFVPSPLWFVPSGCVLDSANVNFVQQERVVH